MENENKVAKQTTVGTYVVYYSYEKSVKPHTISELGWVEKRRHPHKVNELTFYLISTCEMHDDIPIVYVTEYEHYAIVAMRAKNQSHEWRLDMDKKLFPHDGSEPCQVLEFKIQEMVELTWESYLYNGKVNIKVVNP